MSTHWARAWIGRPWQAGASGPDAFDCWGLVRFLTRTRQGITVPAIPVPPHDLRAVARAFADHPELRHWQAVTAAREGDAVLLARARQPIHVGLWITPEESAPGVLHALEGPGVVFQSRQALADHGWTISGTYRHADRPPSP